MNRFSLFLIALLTPVAAVYALPAAAQTEGPPATPRAAQSAPEILTLETCLKRALANSAAIAAERHRLVAMDEGRKQLLWMPFSDFSIKGVATIVPDKCADTTGGAMLPCDGESSIPSDNAYKDMNWGPSFHIGLEGALPIPVSNKFFAAVKATEAAIAAKTAMLPTIESQIRYNVHRAWHAVVGAREMLYTLSEGQKQLASARKRVEDNLAQQTGTETEIDLIKLKIFEAQIDAMVTQSRQIEKTALASLAFLTGQPADKKFDLPDDPQVQIQAQIQTLEEYKRIALNHRPELEALRHAVEAMNAKLDIARSEFAPELAFVVNFKAGYTPGVQVREQETRSDGTTFYDDASTPFLYKNSYNYGSLFPGMALVMRYPLDIGMDIHRVRQSKAELSAIVLEQKQALEAIMLEVENTYTEITTISATIDSLNQARRLTKGWMAAAIQNHAAGVGGSKEVKDALKEYFMTMAQIHQKIGEFNIGLARLDQVTGMLNNKK